MFRSHLGDGHLDGGVDITLIDDVNLGDVFLQDSQLSVFVDLQIISIGRTKLERSRFGGRGMFSE